MQVERIELLSPHFQSEFILCNYDFFCFGLVIHFLLENFFSPIFYLFCSVLLNTTITCSRLDLLFPCLPFTDTHATMCVSRTIFQIGCRESFFLRGFVPLGYCQCLNFTFPVNYTRVGPFLFEGDYRTLFPSTALMTLL